MVKNRKRHGKKNSKKIQKMRATMNELRETRILVSKIDAAMLRFLKGLAYLHLPPMDNFTSGSREMYGIFSVSKLMTGCCGLLTICKWTMDIPIGWIPPCFIKMLRVVLGYNTVDNKGNGLPLQVPLSNDSRLTWYSIRRMSELFLNCRIQSPVLQGQYLRGAHFKEFYQVLQQDNFQRSYLIDVGYWSNNVYHQLWILYNGTHRCFLSLYVGSLTRIIDLPSDLDNDTARALDSKIRIKFLGGTSNLDPVDKDDPVLFGWLSAKYTPYYLMPRKMTAIKFQERYDKMLQDLDVVDNAPFKQITSK